MYSDGKNVTEFRSSIDHFIESKDLYTNIPNIEYVDCGVPEDFNVNVVNNILTPLKHNVLKLKMIVHVNRIALTDHVDKMENISII